MERYDYYARVAKDLRDNLHEWFETHDINGYAGSFGKLSSHVKDYFMESDAVTGDMSGSPAGQRDAEENLSQNMGLFLEAMGHYGFDGGEYACFDAEERDTLVRFYVLERVADGVIREYVAENYPGFGA